MKRIVIIGAGFAGLAAAKAFKHGFVYSFSQLAVSVSPCFCSGSGVF